MVISALCSFLKSLIQNQPSVIVMSLVFDNETLGIFYD